MPSVAVARFSTTRVLLVVVVTCCTLTGGLGDNYRTCTQNTYHFEAHDREEGQNSNFQYHHQSQIASKEFGIRRYSKTLHCCADNFKSISWYKDGKPYPWSEDVSNFVIDAQSKNRTLFAKSLSKEDAGAYSCVIDNDDSYPAIRRLTLKVFGTGYTGTPINTFLPPPMVYASIGGKVELYCEAFVGNIKLPDAQNKINWFKVVANDTRVLLPAHDLQAYVEKVVRDDGLTLGLNLVWEKVKSDDYGVYVCSASNAADQIADVYSEIIEPEHSNKLSLTYVWLIILYAICASFFFILLVYCFLYRQFGYRIRLHLRQYTANDDEDKRKEYDIFVLYEMKEIDFVTSHLIPTLVNKYDYTLSSHALETSVAINMECQARIAASKKVLLVLSCPSSEHAEEMRNFSQKLHTASNLHTKVVCLLVQINSLKKLKNAEMSKHAPWSTFIVWPVFKKDWSNSWCRLRLQLPIKRETSSTNSLKRYSTVNDKHIVNTL